MRDGHSTGVPVMVQRDMGRFSALHLSANGALLHWRSPVTDVEISAFDPENGIVVGAPRTPEVRVSGANSAPGWSPDGRSLVYVSERKAVGAARSRLVIHSLDTGHERELPVPIHGQLDPVWAPDGRTILVPGPGAIDGIRDVRTIDVASGGVKSVFPFVNVGNLQWAADGRAFYLVGQKSIDRVDVASAQRTSIDLAGWSPAPIALSPDGSTFAMIARKSDAAALVLIPVSGGGPRVVVAQHGTDVDLRSVMDWTPDGTRVLATRSTGQKQREPVELITVSIPDGAIKPTGLVREGLSSVRMRPDGRAIAYRVGANVRTLWIIEHFLTDGARTNR